MVRLALTSDELGALRQVSRHYERVMGFARHVVVATSLPRIRRRYRHIVDESTHLEQMAIAWAGGEERADGCFEVAMSGVEAVAFWGRLLSNTRTKCSRRKLSVGTIDVQERLAETFRMALVRMPADCLRAAVATRRRREREWMEAELAGEHVMHRTDMPHQVP